MTGLCIYNTANPPPSTVDAFANELIDGFLGPCLDMQRTRRLEPVPVQAILVVLKRLPEALESFDRELRLAWPMPPQFDGATVPSYLHHGVALLEHFGAILMNRLPVAMQTARTNEELGEAAKWIAEHASKYADTGLFDTLATLDIDDLAASIENEVVRVEDSTPDQQVTHPNLARR
jgi:hypothetical protein